MNILKKNVICCASSIIVFSFTGCSDDNTGNIAKELDFSVIEQNLDASFENSDVYSMYDSCVVSYDADKNDLNITIAVADSLDPNISIDYAKYAISTINYEAQLQNSDIDEYSASENYYGGLFDDVDAFITVSPVSASSEYDYFIFESIPRGSNRKVKLNN